MRLKIVVLTGAGMSAESGLKTFRDADGLWEGHDVTKVASPEGFRQNPELVLEFYNQRRRQLKETEPNQGHHNLFALELFHDVSIVTQNVDNLHERAGSTDVLHLHGELTKVRSTQNEALIYDWTEDLNIGDTCAFGSQLRPHIVWFGEEVPLLQKAAQLVNTADILVIIGTSMQVYPAASLIHYRPIKTPVYFIDPRPTIDENSHENLHLIRKTAVEGTKELMHLLAF